MITTGANPLAAVVLSDLKKHPGKMAVKGARAAGAWLVPADLGKLARAGKYNAVKWIVNEKRKESQ